MQKEKISFSYDQNVIPTRKLLVRRMVCLDQKITPVELQRGMPICGQDGIEAGVIAAVVLDCRCQEVTHILFGYVPPTAVYHLIPLNLIDSVSLNSVWLQVASADVAKLPIYEAE